MLLIDAPSVLIDGEGASLLTPVSRAWLKRIIASKVPVLVFRAGDHTAVIQQELDDDLGVHVVAGERLPGLGAMMTLLQQYQVDLSEAWWLSADTASFSLAGSVGCGSGVLLGSSEVPAGLGLRVVLAQDFADAPRVMIPVGGGCWHDYG